MPYRYDMTTLGNVERTPQGGVKIPAALTRVGVFTYRSPDGSTRREFRPASEVFSKDSIATLQDAPVTDMHPTEMVRPGNFRKYAIGHVRDIVTETGGTMVAAKVLVQDADTIALIDSGKRKEVSCGYACKLDMTPGEYEGETYDAVQRDIVYNHVALGPPGWGRQGSKISLRLDSGDCIVDSLDSEDPLASSVIEEKPVMKIRFDGKEYEAGSTEHLDAIEAKHVAALKAQADASAGRCDALTADAARLTAEVTALKDPARIDAAVSARVALIGKASKALGADFKFDGKSDLEIMTAVLVKADPAFKADGRSADYIGGMFEARATAVRTDDKSIHAALTVATTAPAGDTPATAIDSAKNRKDMLDEQRKRASEPMALSK